MSRNRNRNYNNNNNSNNRHGAQQPIYTLDNDVSIPQPLTSDISCIGVNRASNGVSATSWDGAVSIYSVKEHNNQVVAFEPVKQYKHAAPALSTDIDSDDTVFSGAADGIVKYYDMRNTTPNYAGVDCGRHDKAVRHVKCLHDKRVVVTGGWDGKLCVWDKRQPPHKPVQEKQLGERVFAMDGNAGFFVAATADNKLHCIDASTQLLHGPTITYDSPCKYQTRVVRMFEDTKDPGFGVGTIEGRVALEYMSEVAKKTPQGARSNKNFVFKCHRDKVGGSTFIYSVNDLAFHPIYNTLATAGSDGKLVIWDKDSRHRKAEYDRFKVGSQQFSPFTSVKFSPHGQTMFYATSYDWSMGANPVDSRGTSLNPQAMTKKIFAHNLVPKEVEKKPR